MAELPARDWWVVSVHTGNEWRGWEAWGIYRSRRGALCAASRCHSQRDYVARVEYEHGGEREEIRRYGDGETSQRASIPASIRAETDAARPTGGQSLPEEGDASGHQ